MFIPKQKAWICGLIVCVAMVASGITPAQSTTQQQQQPTMTEEERQKVMQRLMEQMQKRDAAQRQTVAPTPEQPRPATPPPPAAVPPTPPPAAAPQTPPPVPAVVQRAPMASGQVQLSYDNADLYEFISQITDTLGLTPVVIDPEVKGNVTIHSSSPMSKEDLLPLFNLILKNNNAAIVKQGEIYQIVPTSSGLKKGLDVIEHLPPEPPAKSSTDTTAKPNPGTPAAPAGTPATTAPQQAPQSNAPGTSPRPQAPQTGAAGGTQTPSSGESRSSRLATHIIRVEFVPVRDLLEPVKLFMTDGGVIMPYERLNMLIVTDYGDSIGKILELIHLLDNRYLDADHIELIKIENNPVTDVLDDLKKIFGNGTKDSATGISFVSLERSNSILVMANSKRGLEEVRRWIKELDATTGRSVQTFVYTVQNSTASNIATMLMALYGGEAGPGGAGSTGAATGPFGSARSGVSGGLGGGGGGFTNAGSGAIGGMSGNTPTAAGGGFGNQANYNYQGGGTGGGYGGGAFGGGGYGGGGYGGGGFGGGGFGGGLLGAGQQLGPRLGQGQGISSQILRGGAWSGLQDTVRIVVDDINNSLIIQASAPDYSFLLDTIKKMDVLPRQAIIDARVFAIDLNDDLTFGVSATLQARTNQQHLTTGAIDAATGALSASTFAFIGSSREILMALNALRQKTKVQILQAPSVLALDGTVARIIVGSEYPYSTGSYSPTTAGGGVINSTQYRDTGISLIVQPRISASGAVTLEVAQEVSSPGVAVPQPGGGSAPQFNKSSVSTTLSVKDGETVAIAGLIRDSNSLGRSGVPLLSNIPLIGALFGTTTRSSTRSELLILITPHVIRTAEEFRDMSQRLKDTLRHDREFVDSKTEETSKDVQDAQRERERQQEELQKQEEKRQKKEEEKKSKQAEPPPAEKPVEPGKN